MANGNETVRFTDDKLLEMADGHSVVYNHNETIKILAKELLESRHAAEWMNDCIKGSCVKIRFGAKTCNGCALAAKDAEIERMIVANNAAIDTMQSRIDEMVEIVSAKDAEIAKHERCYHALEVHCKKLEEEYLRATNALKPVMDACAEDAKCDAVREAQRIYKEGESK